MQKNLARLLLVLVIAAAVAAFFYFDLRQHLSLQALQDSRELFASWYKQQPLTTALLYVAVYVAVTGLSLPGASVLTLAGGALFGLGVGTVLVSFASTIGATLAFLCARFLLRDWVRIKFSSRLTTIDEGMKRHGRFYLFSLRLIPIVPFFVINLVMGLTPMRTRDFFFVSQLGMLPGTLVYVNAGTQIASIRSLSGILSFDLLVSFLLLALFPWITRAAMGGLETRRLYRRFAKPKRFDYDVVVIGGGSGGLVSSYISAALKAKVALVERQHMGGDCLNFGCVPSKALIQSAKIAHYARKSQEFGVSTGEVRVDFAAVLARVKHVITEIAPHDSIERYTKLGTDCLVGEAKILSPYLVTVGDRTLVTRNIIIATGAAPIVPKIPGIDKIKYVTTDTFWSLREQPRRLLIIGGGPIGCELSQAMARLGSEVTVVEKGAQILAREDSDIAALVSEKMRADGVSIICAATLSSFSTENQALILHPDGREESIAFDLCLFAVGRKSRVEHFGLEELGVELTSEGRIRVDDFMQTNFKNIYACGDVVGPYFLTHVAAHQAWYCAVNALCAPLRRFRVNNRVIPWCTFTDPQCARVGLSEAEARERGIAYEVHSYGIDDLDRAIADGDNYGMVKVLTTPGHDEIIGASIVGTHAGETITEFVNAMKNGYGLNQILGTIHAYPTHAEANKYVAGVWKRAHAPTKVLAWVARYHRFRRWLRY